MKLLLDFFALILFFAVYAFTGNIYTATAVAIVAGMLQAAFTWWKYKKLDTMQWIGLGLIIVFGGATILLHNPIFIKWKPSLLFWAMSLTIFIGTLMKRNVLKVLLGKEIELPEHIWQRLSYAWLTFFFLLGIANLFVAYRYSEKIWVSYKVFGTMSLMLFFFIAQAIYMAKYLPQEESKKQS